jgi:hypothetical protein
MQLLRNVAQPHGRCCSRSCRKLLLLRWHSHRRPICSKQPAPLRMSYPLAQAALGRGSQCQASAVSGVSVKPLDFRPTLSIWSEALCCALASLSSAGVALAWRRVLQTQAPILVTVLLFAFIWQFLRNELLEQQYEVRGTCRHAVLQHVWL